MARYTLPTPPPFRPAAPDPTEVSGEDVMFQGGLQISNGDWRTIAGDDSAEQSVIREASANVGAHLRRPEWGMGIVQELFQSVTQSRSQTLISRVRTRMVRNPRVGRFIGADIVRLPGVSGSAVSIKYEPVGVRSPKITVIRSAKR